MPQRILVLGASGYIGQHLVRTLSQQGHQILAAASCRQACKAATGKRQLP